MDHGHGAHDKHAGHHVEDFLTKFWVVLVLTVPILAYSDLPEAFFGMSAPSFPGSQYLELLLGSIVFFYGGLVFLRGAWREVEQRLPGMMTLIALAITSAYAYSVGAVLFGAGMTLFWELSTLIAVMLIGHWIEMKAVRGASGALKELAKLLPDTAEVVRGSTTETVPLTELKEGDVVLVRPGGKVPADGEVVEGSSELDESVLTGESRPVQKEVGSVVIAGAINGDGSLRVRVSLIGEATFLAGVMRLVREAEMSKSRLQLLSDRAAMYLTFLAVSAGIITFGAWLSVGESFGFAVERLVAVLVIACPHALGLAIPLVASISTTMAAQSGFFVKRRLSLEVARSITTVLFDKTGTLTQGAFGIDTIIAGASTVEEVLRLAVSVNSHSEHPLARAMLAEAKTRGIVPASAQDFKRIPGKGVEARVEGELVRIGSQSLLEESGVAIPSEAKEQILALSKQGKTINHVIRAGVWVGSIALADIIREESREAIRALQHAGIKVAMITGDSTDVASWVAGELSIDEYFGNVLPGEKAEKVRVLQARGERVAMVGDGVNDAPALTQADLGIAIGAGTNVAIESAGIILVRNDPRDIPKIITLSRLTYTKMIQNLFWATGYNIIALPVAAGALAVYGIMLQPAVAAVCMSLSTVIVAFNAMLLRSKSLASRMTSREEEIGYGLH